MPNQIWRRRNDQLLTINVKTQPNRERNVLETTAEETEKTEKAAVEVAEEEDQDKLQPTVKNSGHTNDSLRQAGHRNGTYTRKIWTALPSPRA